MASQLHMWEVQPIAAKRRVEHPNEYQNWYDRHKITGFSNSMEPVAVKLIWSSSLEKRKLCCTSFIGNADSKSFQQVLFESIQQFYSSQGRVLGVCLQTTQKDAV